MSFNVENSTGFNTAAAATSIGIWGTNINKYMPFVCHCLMSLSTVLLSRGTHKRELVKRKKKILSPLTQASLLPRLIRKTEIKWRNKYVTHCCCCYSLFLERLCTAPFLLFLRRTHSKGLRVPQFHKATRQTGTEELF